MRFHMGFSFGFKQIKKYIVPILLGILAYFGFSSFGLINVYAEQSYTNYDTNYNFNYVEEDFENTQFSSEYTFQDIFDMFVGYESPYYNIILTYGLRYEKKMLNIFLVPKENGFSPLYFFGVDYSKYQSDTISSNILKSSYSLTLNQNPNNSIKPYIDNVFMCLNNNDCSKLASGDYFNFLKVYLPSTSDDLSSSIISNDLSYSYDLSSSTSGEFVYYSQVALIFSDYRPSNNQTSYTYYFKSINFNGNTLKNGDIIPTYYDIYSKPSSNPSNQSNFITYDEFGDLFVSNIPKDNLSNLRVDFTFDFNDENFVKDLHFLNLLYGRKDNETYYSYEPLEDCYFHYSSSYGDTTYDIVFNDLKCSADLTQYDNIYIKITPYNYDTNASTFIRNYTYKSNYGYIDNISNKRNYYSVMEHFTNLPSDFNILLSTTEEESYASIKTDNSFALMSPYYYDTNKIGHTAYGDLAHFGKKNLTSLMVYNYKYSNDNPTKNLNLFFSTDVILSYNKNNSFTHYDKDNNLTTNDIVNNYQSIISNNDDGFSNLGGISSLLPSGPVDSLLSIPINFLNRSINALNGTCSPFKTKYVFDQELEIPCFGDYYESFPSSSKILLDTIPSAFLLIAYFKHLYRKVDRATSLQADSNDDWGVL